MTALSARDRILAKRGAIAADRSKGIKPYKWRVGITKFRILPARDTAVTPTMSGEWDRKYGKTYIKDFTDKLLFAIGDREVTYGQHDPFRDMIFDAMRATSDPQVKEHYRKMLSSPKNIFCALILDDPNVQATEPQLIEMGDNAFDSILAQAFTWAEENEDYDPFSLQTGHVFQCERVGTGATDTRYTFTITPKVAPLAPAILDKTIDLDGWVQSQFENLDTKALEAMQKVNALAGISVAAPAIQIAGPAQTQAPKPQQVAQTSVSPAAVTSLLEDDEVPTFTKPDPQPIEQEVIEEAVFVQEPAPVQVATPAQTPAAQTPAAQAPAANVATDSADIDDILAGLQ